MVIKIKTFTCPICKKGQTFNIMNFDTIRCDTCKEIIPNPIFKEKRPFSIQFIENIIILDGNEDFTINKDDYDIPG